MWMKLRLWIEQCPWLALLCRTELSLRRLAAPATLANWQSHVASHKVLARTTCTLVAHSPFL